MQCNEELGQKSEKFVSGFVRWQLSGFESFPTNLLSFGLMSSNVHNLQCERHHRSLQTFTWETFIVEKKWKLGLLTQVADLLFDLWHQTRRTLYYQLIGLSAHPALPQYLAIDLNRTGYLVINAHPSCQAFKARRAMHLSPRQVWWAGNCCCVSISQ